MTVEYECLQCGKKLQGPFGLFDNIIQHIAQEHFGGEVRFSEMMRWILVKAVGVGEEEIKK